MLLGGVCENSNFPGPELQVPKPKCNCWWCPRNQLPGDFDGSKFSCNLAAAHPHGQVQRRSHDIWCSWCRSMSWWWSAPITFGNLVVSLPRLQLLAPQISPGRQLVARERQNLPIFAVKVGWCSAIWASPEKKSPYLVLLVPLYIVMVVRTHNYGKSRGFFF